MSKLICNHYKEVNNAAKGLIQTTSVFVYSIKNNWKPASSHNSCSIWFIESGYITHISSQYLMFIRVMKYLLNMKNFQGFNVVIPFATGYESVRLRCQLSDLKTNMIINCKVVHLQESFSLIS